MVNAIAMVTGESTTAEHIGVVAVDVETGAHRWLVETDGNHAAEPVFSPDGSTIVYSNRGAIWRVPLDGSADPEVMAGVPDYPPSHDATAFVSPGWTPDGRLVYIHDISDGLPPILVASPDGSDPTELARGYQYQWLPTPG